MMRLPSHEWIIKMDWNYVAMCYERIRLKSISIFHTGFDVSVEKLIKEFVF